MGEERKIESLQELERKSVREEKPVAPEKKNETPSYEKAKSLSKEARKIRNRVKYLEDRIMTLETRQAEIEKILSNPGEKDDIMELTREYLENKRTSDALTDEWGNLSEQMEQ